MIVCTDGESSDGDIADAMRPLQDLPVWVVIRLCTDEEQIVDYWNNVDGELEIGSHHPHPHHNLLFFVLSRFYTHTHTHTYTHTHTHIHMQDMDVLDDIRGEADEVRAVNNWLYYGEPLHRLREFGATIKEMDLLDEASLSSEQMVIQHTHPPTHTHTHTRRKRIRTQTYPHTQHMETYIQRVVVSTLIHTGNARDLPHPDEDFDVFLEQVKQCLAKSQDIFDPLVLKMKPWINVPALVKTYRFGTAKSSACCLS